ncbi:MAG TPA: hypothetical protein VKB80_18305 [Kofleriaceae bacterium]|nr:hypothetical protein [Kofleriaceae bacterium]
MRAFDKHETPPALLERGLALGLIDLPAARELIELPAPSAAMLDRRGKWIAAVLAAAVLDPGERDALEQRGIAAADALQALEQRRGLQLLAELAPHLSPTRRAHVRAQARPLLAAHRTPADGQLWRMLAPDEYADWLREIGVLGRAWGPLSLAGFLQRLALLPGLADAERRQLLDSALASVEEVRGSHLDESAEQGIGGVPRYTAEQIASAHSNAPAAAWNVLGALLPADVRERALALRPSRSAPSRTPARLVRSRWGALRWVPQQLGSVAAIAWIAAGLSAGELAPLAAALAARFAELAPLAARGVTAARESLDLVLPVALPPIAPALGPVHTAAMLTHYGLADEPPPRLVAPARGLPAALLPPPLLAPVLAFGLLDLDRAMRHVAAAPVRPPRSIGSWVDFPAPARRVDLLIAVLAGAPLDEGQRAGLEAQAVDGAHEDQQTGPVSRAMLLPSLSGERRAASLQELRAELSPHRLPGEGPDGWASRIGSLWWNRPELLEHLAPALPDDLLHAALERHIAQHPPAQDDAFGDEVFRARLSLIPYLDGATLRRCQEAALDAALRPRPGSRARGPIDDDVAARSAGAALALLALLAPYLPEDLRAAAREAAQRSGLSAPERMAWTRAELEGAMRDHFLSPRCHRRWTEPHFLAPYSARSRWQDALPSWRRIASILAGLGADRRAPALDDLCERLAALAVARARGLSIDRTYWPLVTVGLRAAASFLDRDRVAALLGLFAEE